MSGMDPDTAPDTGADASPGRAPDPSPEHSKILPDHGDAVVCPVPCATCDELGPGGCEDCLDCLLWPELPPPRARGLPPLPGRTSPLRTEELSARRAALDIGARIGLVSRRHRGARALSQRALAEQLGWSQPSVNRAEHDGATLTVGRAEVFLRHLGFRLAVVRADHPTGDHHGLAEDPDTTWGTSELVVRDAVGRRPPPYAIVTWQSDLDRRIDHRAGEDGPEWTWRHPA